MSRIEPPVGGTTDPRVLLAATNNAAWCTSMCRAHGLEPHQDRQRWWSTSRTPLYYPDVVTLDPALSIGDVLAEVDTSTGCSVKDSFATLDLTAAGFHELFEADWIHRPALGAAGRIDGAVSGWRAEVVKDEHGLQQWIRGWGEDGGRLFMPALLHDSDVRLVRMVEGDQTVGVAALNRSPGAVGVSNLACTRARAEQVWQLIAGVASALFPAQDLVGYEQGQDLVAARAAGFSQVGPLRVWGV